MELILDKMLSSYSKDDLLLLRREVDERLLQKTVKVNSEQKDFKVPESIERLRKASEQATTAHQKEKNQTDAEPKKTQTDYRSPQKGSLHTGGLTLKEQSLLPKGQKPYDGKPSREARLSSLYNSGNQQLQQLFEMLRGELEECPAYLPKIFLTSEEDLALYISGCLPDEYGQNGDTPYIRTLIRIYKVFLFHRDGKILLSVSALCSLLNDNFSDSCLCKLVNIIFLGEEGIAPTAIHL